MSVNLLLPLGGEKNSHPQNKILVTLGGTFQNFKQAARDCCPGPCLDFQKDLIRSVVR